MRFIAVLLVLASSLAQAQSSAGPRPPFIPSSDAIRVMNEHTMQTGMDQSGQADKKNVGMAALYSLLLPGMGELYAGDYSFGKYFTILEGGLVVTLIGFDRYANWLQDDARAFAQAHAQASINGKDDRYFNAIGDFNNVNAYNAEVLRQRDPQNVYDPHSTYYWSWDDPSNRAIYRDKKVASDGRFNDTRFVAAAIVVNHVVSAVNAARTAISHNKQVDAGSLYDLHADVIGGYASPQGIRLTLTRHF